MSVLHRVLNVIVMQHSTLLVDLFNVHVTLDFQEMEQYAQVQKNTKIIKLLNLLYNYYFFYIAKYYRYTRMLFRNFTIS